MIKIPIPPKTLMFLDKNEIEFLKAGDSTLKIINKYIEIKDDISVLDIGCGYGRLAHAFIRNKKFHGEYIGIDILPEHIKWCKANLVDLCGKRINFYCIDMKNEVYNPNGTLNIKNVNLDIAPVDLVTVINVFNHMHYEDVRNYLYKIYDLLDNKGKVYIVLFLLNDEQRKLELQNKSSLPMKYGCERFYKYYCKCSPLYAIAYEEGILIKLFNELSYKVEDISYGSWCGRKNKTSYEDIIILSKN